MEVNTINSRESAEEDVIRCARGDYSWGSVSSEEKSLEELIGYVEPKYWRTDLYDDELEQKKAEYLHQRMNERHWGIWEHPSITLEIEGVSRSAMAQITRHRHFSFDIMSNRYVNVEDVPFDDLFIYPPSFENEEVTTRDGAREIELSPEDRKRVATKVYNECLQRYQQFVDAGVPEEDARFLLPQGQATNIRMSGNARALMHLLNVRLNANVQWEAREGMEKILEECKNWMPISFELFERKRPIPLAP